MARACGVVTIIAPDSATSIGVDFTFFDVESNYDYLFIYDGADISAVEAWDVTKGKREVVIAVIDDGFELSHPDFVGGGKIAHPLITLTLRSYA